MNVVALPELSPAAEVPKKLSRMNDAATIPDIAHYPVLAPMM
jgi:hypothetical protein